jgi:hypothetical protein
MSGVLAVLAFACGTSGTPIFTEHEEPLPDPNGAAVVATTDFTLWPSGAWRRSVTRTNRLHQAFRLDVQEGCVDPARLALLAPSLARATYTAHEPRITCRAMANVHITFSSPARGRSVAIDAPCREQLDPGTATAQACVDAITDWSQGPDDYGPICRGES